MHVFTRNLVVNGVRVTPGTPVSVVLDQVPCLNEAWVSEAVRCGHLEIVGVAPAPTPPSAPAEDPPAPPPARRGRRKT
jgi:hypothetical protein